MPTTATSSPAPGEAPVTKRTTPKEQPREPQLVLLLDDDQMLTDVVARGLERDGRTTITCNDKESAELIVERLRPSHIVADIQLSGPFAFEGLDFIHHAKRHAPGARIIVVSDHAPDALQLEASQRGAVAFLHKPFEIRELDSILDMMSCPIASSDGGYRGVIRMPLLQEILTSTALVPFFQPIVRLDRKWSTFGYESLARYRTDSPVRNPDILFTYAARKHRLSDLEIACVRGALVAGAPLVPVGPLFLNIHPDVFTSGGWLRETLTTHSQRNGVPLDRIVLEITEQARLSDAPIVMKTIGELQKLGVRFAFDDLGLAYSHLPMIDKIRPSFLKISQHFGTRFETDETKRKIIANLLSLANDFDCQLILEGIEDESTAIAAMEMAIPLGQGFYFGRPADASVFAAPTEQA